MLGHATASVNLPLGPCAPSPRPSCAAARQHASLERPRAGVGASLAPRPTVAYNPTNMGDTAETEAGRALVKLHSTLVTLSCGALVVIAAFLREPIQIPGAKLLMLTAVFSLALALTFNVLAWMLVIALQIRKKKVLHPFIPRSITAVSLFGMFLFFVGYSSLCLIALRSVETWP